MTLTEFRATLKRMSADEFCKAQGVDRDMIKSPLVLAYGPDHTLWIEDKDEHGAYYMIIHREEWLTENLLECERALYDFATSEEII